MTRKPPPAPRDDDRLLSYPTTGIERETHGHFAKGRCPNPGGRPRLTAEERELRELARERTPLAIKLLTAAVRGGLKAARRVDDNGGRGDRDDAAIVKAGIVAAESLLNRGWGRPVEFKEVAKKPGLQIIFSRPRGFDPLAAKSALRAHAALPTAPPMSPEDEALAAELVEDYLPGELPR